MLRESLRERTRAQHARLEERLAIEQRVRDPQAYIELLGRFHSFYALIEARLARFEAAFRKNGIDLAERSKVVLLRRDLSALGRIASAPVDEDIIPEIDTFPRAVGCLYVLEGSTLGAQIIMRHVRESLGLDADDGAAFFSGYGDRTSQMWQAFLKFLNALPFGEHDVVQAIDAARETFEALERWLCDESVSMAAEA
jgi:heme oxygenase